MRQLSTQVIPLKLLFEKPKVRLPKLSPKGTHLAYISNVGDHGRLCVRNLTTGSGCCFGVYEDDIQILEWSADAKWLLYIMDHDGDENFKLYALAVSSGEVRCLTDYEQVYVKHLVISHQNPHQVAFEMNATDPLHYQAYRYDLDSHKLEQLSAESADISEYIFDDSLSCIGRVSVDAMGVKSLELEGHAAPLLHWQLSDGVLPHVIGVHSGVMHFASPNAGGYLSLNSYNLETRQSQLIYSADRYDMMNCHISKSDGTIVGVSYMDYYEKQVVLCSRYQDDFDLLDAVFNRQYSIDSASDDFKTVVVHRVDNKGLRAYYILSKGQLTHFADINPQLKELPLAEFEPVRFKARDGEVIEGYMLRPVERTAKPLPLVLNVHGGPWSRDAIDYIASEAQWLQNRGYVALNVNFRGSTGYGTRFLNLGNKAWGQTMHDDLIDAIHWAVDEGYADPKRIAIFGLSYGGYSVLAGLAFTPDVFCCGIDRVGPSNLVYLMEKLPAAWSAIREGFYYRVGHPEKDRALLERYSPIHHIDQIKAPLLIAQGYNDPRVHFSESENVAKRLVEKGQVCEYHCYKDEGHIFEKQHNINHFYEQAELFLKRYL